MTRLIVAVQGCAIIAVFLLVSGLDAYDGMPLARTVRYLAVHVAALVAAAAIAVTCALMLRATVGR